MKELLTKLAKAKSEIGAISKDSKNPFFKSKYFDINQLLEHVEPILLKNGLLLTQPIKENKVWSIVWCIDTGTSIESYLDLPQQNDPQKIGSCISYFRRYTLSSLLSIQAEDDDANKASKKELPTLDTKGFEFLMDKGTTENIKTALNGRKMTDEQRTKLTDKLLPIK